MTKRQKKYNPGRFACVIFMMLSLLWLTTISTPFAYASHQNLVKHGKIAKSTANGHLAIVNRLIWPQDYHLSPLVALYIEIVSCIVYLFYYN